MQSTCRLDFGWLISSYSISLYLSVVTFGLTIRLIQKRYFDWFLRTHKVYLLDDQSFVYVFFFFNLFRSRWLYKHFWISLSHISFQFRLVLGPKQKFMRIFFSTRKFCALVNNILSVCRLIYSNMFCHTKSIERKERERHCKCVSIESASHINFKKKCVSNTQCYLNLCKLRLTQSFDRSFVHLFNHSLSHSIQWIFVINM